MANRYALAFGVFNEAGDVLLVKRRPDEAEFPGYWSIPSVKIDKAGFDAAVANPSLALRCGRRKVSIGPSSQLAFIETCRRERRNYTLQMAFFAVQVGMDRISPTDAYDEFKWVPVGAVADHFPSGGGLCTSMLIRHLIQTRRISDATQYVETPPHLAVGHAEVDNIHAWNSWGYDQYVGEFSNGGDVIAAKSFKTNTLDRYFRRRASEVRPGYATAMDVGCGDGTYVSYLLACGYDARGLDLKLAPDLAADRAFAEFNMEGSDEYPEPGSVDLLTANLVLPWVDDLPAFAGHARRMITEGGRVIASILAPDYAKNGDWVERNGGSAWVIERPVRREPQLAMINHSVGPLLYYPRTILDYVTIFAAAGLYTEFGSYLFLDSELTETETMSPEFERESHRRTWDFPMFAVLEMIRR